MTAAEFAKTILIPGLDFLAATVGMRPPNSDEAKVLLLAIAGQESGWQNIPQGGGGPGRGPWQFEPETCEELRFNPASDLYYARVCIKLNIAPALTYNALIAHPNLAVALARLDLWCDPELLPAIGAEQAAWMAYLRIWRPGKPRPHDWPANYSAAMAALNFNGATS